jgi:hypothetical protein
VDGTKIKAMSYRRMKDAEDRLQAEVDEILLRAEETDEREDREYGKDKRGDELRLTHLSALPSTRSGTSWLALRPVTGTGS